MRYCKHCVNPDTRPNIHFDEDGICLPCRHYEQSRNAGIDWSQRRCELEEIAAWGRANRHSSYDCIVTVSGGKDSTRQAIYARDDLKLKPLLVSCVYPPEQLVERGARNLANLISLGFDTVSMSLNPQVWKTLMRRTFFQHANWCKSTELALYAIPIHVAIAYQIPLVFYGENPAFTIGERCSGLDGDASRLRYSNTLAGGSVQGLKSEELSQTDVYFYDYPPNEDMQHARLRLVYMGYYIENFNDIDNAEFSMRHGLEIRSETAEVMGDVLGTAALDEDFVVLNQMIKYVKYGFGRVTDQMVEAIHLGRIGREEGIDLIRQYDGKCDRSYIQRYCRYLGISEAEFWEVVEGVRNRELFERGSDGEWRLKVVLE